MGVACLVAGLSASQLRTLPLERSLIVAAHWILVALIAAAFYAYGAWRLRRDQRLAGEMLLRVLRRPFTAGRRVWIACGLTAAVVVDGVAMSVFLPYVLSQQRDEAMNLAGVAVQAVVGQGLLWGACLNGWANNLYWLAFHEHGLLTKDRFYPWFSITSIHWSPQVSPRLLVYGDYHLDMTIDPADQKDVSRVLSELRLRWKDSFPPVWPGAIR
jgi:hypothetical protein